MSQPDLIRTCHICGSLASVRIWTITPGELQWGEYHHYCDRHAEAMSKHDKIKAVPELNIKAAL